MVTGAYAPEVSGGGLQCQAVVKVLQERIRFAVLSVTTDTTFPAVDTVDGVPVYRIAVDVNRFVSRVAAGLRLARRFVALRDRFDVVHFHGFSNKTVMLTLLAKSFRRRIILTLHTAGHDEPLTIRARGPLAWWCYRAADLIVGVSPYLQDRYEAAGLPAGKFRLIPGGVDLARFRPGDAAERRALRRALGLPEELPLVLFVGFFSKEKRPQVLFDAWLRVQTNGGPSSGLIFIGATRSRYYEVNAGLAEEIREAARRLGVAERVWFIERTHEIERYDRAVDVFVLASSRESMSMALVEAMASGVPVIATRLPGVTETIIEDGVNGLLVDAGDSAALAAALRRVLTHPAETRELGRRARQRIEERYGIQRTAAGYLAAYG